MIDPRLFAMTVVSSVRAMKPGTLRINPLSSLIVVVAVAILGLGRFTSAVRADNSPSAGASPVVPQNALGQTLTPQVLNELVGLINGGNLADLRWPNFINYREQVLTFYEAGTYTLGWVRNNQPTPQALTLIALFKAAAEDGLNPVDYDGPRWDSRVAGLRAASPDVVHFDLALTVCAMRFVSALHVGRVNPQHFKFGLDVGPKRYDLTEFLRNEIVYAADVNAAVGSVEPHYAGYERLKAALQVYLKLAAQGDGEPVPLQATSVRPGDTYAGMTQLVARLEQLGDLVAPNGSESGGGSSLYQGAVVDGVTHFQRRHGLEPDGVMGKATIAALNTPLQVRVEQIQFALERYRWIPDSFPQSPIVANIPEFRLRTMIKQPGAQPLDMAVVVGKAYHHRTPVFANYMQYVIFRPYWEVPPSIARAELMPKILRDPNYAAAHNFIVDGDRIRQKPGPKNALGLIKFIFPNDYNVYMHGTPATQLFSRSRRDFSHGCIRVEDPATLAQWVLRNNPGWSRDRILAAMNGSDNNKVNLTYPIPVLILYTTAVVEPNGEIHFFDDIYGYDADLKRVLAGGYPYPS
jgi:L,D-transpeptidase YcbB